MNIIKKLLLWVPKNLVAVLGILQVGIKLVKEILTLIVDLLYPVIPSEKFEDIVDMIREKVNMVDEWVERIKDFLLNIGIS